MVEENKHDKMSTLKVTLQRLKQEHRNVDLKISNIEKPILDPLLVRRLKKKKLALKDAIQKISNILTPDIIA